MIFVFFAITLLISLFMLFSLAKNDFMLLRKNISLSEVFDKVFVSLLGALFLGRLVYIFLHSEFYLLHIINFLHVIRLPGISFFGSIVGFVLTLSLLYRKKKALFRIYDIYILAFSPFFILSVFLHKTPQNLFFIPYIVSAVFIGIFIMLVKFHRNYTLKDGSVSSAILSFICIYLFSITFFSERSVFFLKVSIEQIIFLALSIGAAAFLGYNQKPVKKKR